MLVKDFFLFVGSILVISLSTVYCSDWKPIVPPADYYATKPPSCVSDCNVKINYPLQKNPVEEGAESQLKSTVLNQPPLIFNQDKDLRESNHKLDLDGTFFSQDNAFNSPLPTYEDVLRKTPSSFFMFKTFPPQKPTKTLYYGDLESAKPKIPEEGKHFKGYKSGFREDIRIFKPSNFIENEVKSYRPTKGNSYEEQCTLYKCSFRQDLFYQYIQYKVHMPELKEFTICLWTRFHNHSHDHSLFSYAAKPHRKGIYMWVNNLQEPGQFNMKVLGQTIFRLNYPFMLYKWYHTCQSWNGNSGEWQVWVNSHRIARGFHNLLVGHPIPGGGIAISGQENRHFGKGFQEIPNYLKGSGGLEGEITMLQLYKVALTPGKAYNDHSHHHSHYTTTTPEPPELPSEEPSTTTDHPFLENGQLKKHINVLELAEALRNKARLEMPEQYEQHPSYELHSKPLIHPYLSPISPLAINGNTLHYIGLPSHNLYKRNDGNDIKEKDQTNAKNQRVEEQKENPEKIKVVSNVSGQVHVEKLKYVTEESTNKEVAENEGTAVIPMNLNKKSETIANSTITEKSISDLTNNYENEWIKKDEITGLEFGARKKRLRRHEPHRSVKIVTTQPKIMTTTRAKPARYSTYRIKKRGDTGKTVMEEKETSKRHIVFGDPYVHLGLLDNEENHHSYSDTPLGDISFDHFSILGHDSNNFNDNIEENKDIEESLLKKPFKQVQKGEEVEVAQGEVKKILTLCSGCQNDPFRKVAVISWRSTPKKIYSGALLIKAKSECENF